jgi:hypothetical protein
MNPELPNPDGGEYLAALTWRFGGDEKPSPRLRRPSLAEHSMPYCRCGARAHVEHASDWRNRIDVEMGQVTRVRKCLSCWSQWRTVELRESELNELRRRAYLWERYGDRDNVASRPGADCGR